MHPLIALSVFVVGSWLTWKASLALDDSASRLCVRYDVPPLLQGTLVVAVASSFPELTATVASAALHGDAALGIATVVGSAIFNILVIPAAACLARRDLRYDITLVYRDAQFYLTTVAVIVLTFTFVVIYSPDGDEPLTGVFTRPFTLLPLALYGLYVFLQHQELRGRSDQRPEAERAELGGSAAKDFGVLAMALVGVVLGVEGLLRVALWLGEVLSTPSLLWGGTIVAAVTSAPDLVVSVRAAKRGEGEVSLGNVLGSNIFDLLVAVPAGVLVAGAVSVDLGVVAPLMGALTLATVALFAFLRTGLRVSPRECVALLVLYAAFVTWLALEATGVTNLLLT